MSPNIQICYFYEVSCDVTNVHLLKIMLYDVDEDCRPFILEGIMIRNRTLRQLSNYPPVYVFYVHHQPKRSCLPLRSAVTLVDDAKDYSILDIQEVEDSTNMTERSQREQNLAPVDRLTILCGTT